MKKLRFKAGDKVAGIVSGYGGRNIPYEGILLSKKKNSYGDYDVNLTAPLVDGAGTEKLPVNNEIWIDLDAGDTMHYSMSDTPLAKAMQE